MILSSKKSTKSITLQTIIYEINQSNSFQYYYLYIIHIISKRKNILESFIIPIIQKLF